MIAAQSRITVRASRVAKPIRLPGKWPTTSAIHGKSPATIKRRVRWGKGQVRW